MPPIPFADNFLASSLLTILMPTLLLTAIAIWYVLAVRRAPKDTPTSSASLPSPEVLAAASQAATEDTPAEPPGGES
jgi:hypothetical protein